MSGDGYEVDPDALRQTAQGINEIVDELKAVGVAADAEQGRGFANLALSGLQLGNNSLKSALDTFCSRWEWGVRTLVQDGNEIASRLHLSAGLYHEQEQYLSGVLKDVVSGIQGNPHLANAQVEKESWNQVALDNPLTQFEHADYSGKSFADSWQHSEKVWSGEGTDLKQLGEQALLPGVGTVLVQGQHLSGIDSPVPGSQTGS